MSYRSGVLRCPACAGAMQEQRFASVGLDVCDDCGGVWIEWFDGDPASVARVVPSRRGIPGQQLSERKCPSCRVALDRVRYPDVSDGAEVARCGECAGTFVAANQVAVLARAPEPDAQPQEEEHFFRALLDRLRAWLAAGRP
ncbi:MAG: zf-TFIIB domain-containing protein [Polyangiaceae bacterium]